MADIAGAILWWEEWQLRILVLGSLALQWFLVLTAPMRKYSICWFLRKCIWLAYVGSDAVSIYALATLFNRHALASSSCAYGDKASSLEVLWAPILLVHLGGWDEITAFNIEDNELWTRHTVTLVSQVTVALYAFYKSWPGGSDRRLLLSAIMLFICGIINFCEKPLALKRATINQLVAMSSVIEGERWKPEGCCDILFTGWRWKKGEGKPEGCCDILFTGWRWKKGKDLTEMDQVIEGERSKHPEEDLTEMDQVKEGERRKPKGCCDILFTGWRWKDEEDLTEMDQVQMILSDMSMLAAIKSRGKTPAKLSPGPDMTNWLRQAFELIYTRANVVLSPVFCVCNFLLVPVLHVAAIILFAVSRKQEYNGTDIKMTYILMCSTAVLDVLGFLIGMLIYEIMSCIRATPLCLKLPGRSLINSALQRKKHPLITTLCSAKCAAFFLSCKPDSVCARTNNPNVAEFVVFELLKPGKVKNLDLASYRSLEAGKNWALGDDLVDYVRNNATMRRILCDSPFDESVLIWHIATDLCFRAGPDLLRPSSPSSRLREKCTEAISNYMAYLLSVRPQMLMTGSRKHLFTRTMQDLEQLLPQNIDSQMDNNLANDIINQGKECTDHRLVKEACKLVDELVKIEDDETRCKLLYRVWMGMLCYSASMCRGYLHAQALAEGGEFLSYVWLVISLKGAKTLADKLQMPQQLDVDYPAPAQESQDRSSEDDYDITSMLPSVAP